MSDYRLMSEQLRSLLAGLSKHGVAHLTEIENDLNQTNVLLEEAIGKLVASFMAIHGALSVQQEMIDNALADKSPALENLSGIKAISEDIDRHISDVITSMQFHDMTRQLLERTTKRAVGLRGMMGSLGSSGAGFPGDSGMEQVVAVLRSINRQLFLQNKELNQMLWKTVRQKHMDVGDVELF